MPPLDFSKMLRLAIQSHEDNTRSFELGTMNSLQICLNRMPF